MTPRISLLIASLHVLLYLVRLADKLGVDLESAAHAKIARNAEKYPVEKARGSSRKYDAL